jgi:hypothetical protein
MKSNIQWLKKASNRTINGLAGNLSTIRRAIAVWRIKDILFCYKKALIGVSVFLSYCRKTEMAFRIDSVSLFE